MCDTSVGRAGLFARLAATGDFRPGSINATYRRCGKQNCACARPGHPGHGPPDWLARRLAELDAGDIAALLTAGRDLKFTGSLARERDKALGYFEANAHRMRYRHFRALGMFIGSGTVVAGCKAIIGQRLRLSGMRWNVPRRDKHRHPAMPGSQQPLGTHLAAPPHPDTRPPPAHSRKLILLPTN